MNVSPAALAGSEGWPLSMPSSHREHEAQASAARTGRGRLGPNPAAGTLEWSCERTDQGEASDQGQRRSQEPGPRGGQPLADLRRVSAPRAREPTLAPRLLPPDTCRSRAHAALPLGRCRSTDIGERAGNMRGRVRRGLGRARGSPGRGRSLRPGSGHWAFRTAVPSLP